jgi:hypothetical protein
MSDPSLVTLTPRDVTVIDTPGAPDDGRTKPVANGSEILVATAPGRRCPRGVADRRVEHMTR